MIDSAHHVEINGVKYKLFVGGKGDHYTLLGEPLRPPNSVIVQGEGRQDRFQMRPDVILWSITDWSGGEGRIKYDPSNAAQHAILQNVDPFTRPGQLLPGPAFVETLDSLGATWNDDQTIALPVGIDGTLWAVDVATTTINMYEWNDSTERWSAADAMTTPTGAGSRDGVDADDDYLYFWDSGSGDLYKATALTDNGTKMNSTSLGTGPAVVRALGDYVYIVQPQTYKTYEIPKTASGSDTFTEVDNDAKATANVGVNYGFQVAKGPNRLYIMLTGLDGFTRIREIVPSTAAGAGYGKEIATFPGVHGTSLWYHNGTLLMGAWETGASQSRRVLLYLVPGGDYGTLGYVRAPELENYNGRIIGVDDGGTLLTNHFLVYGTGINPRVYVVDAEGGGMAQIGEIASSGITMSPPVVWKGELFVPSYDGVKRIWRGQSGTYQDNGYFVSPWHDMGLADDKILSSIVLSCEALPADWDIKVYYATDGSSSFTLASTYTTDNGTGTRIPISTDTTTVSFRALRIKVEFDYTGAGTPTTAPVLNAVDVRAQVAKPARGWRLLLDLSDDLSGQTARARGNAKIDNLQTLAASEAAFDFKDGYTDRRNGQYDQYDCVLDQYHLVLERPGEGYAEVVMREVV